MLPLTEIADFLNQLMHSDRFPDDDPHGIYRPCDRPVQRLGLALDPHPHLPDWLHYEPLDALFLHRPWNLDVIALPVETGVLAYHLAFDERLTLGFNPELAATLEMSQLEVLGKKHDRPIGMIGTVPTQAIATLCDRLNQTFNGLEKTYACQGVTSRIAVVGAMNAALIQEAHDRGADLYITGQLRKLALPSVDETGIAVVAVGHDRAERWGLRSLAHLLTQHWEGLQIKLIS